MMSPWLRRVLSRRLSVANLAEMWMWAAVAYLTIGLTWAFLHADAVQRIQERLEQQLHLPIAASYQLAALGEAGALWPVITVLPSPNCGP